jgi:hypothetical protein
MIKEFVCPNGRMSVNGVCPIFEGDDGQIKDFKKRSTYDALKEDEIFGEEKIKEEKGIFEFDFMKPTESAFESAGNIIRNNINAYNSFIEDKLGMSSNVQNVFRIGTAIATSSLMPFAIPFIAGGALRNSENTRIQNITNQDTQGTINTVVSPSTMNIQPSNRDIAMGGGSFNQPDGSGGYTGGFDSSTGNYSDPYSNDTE